MIIKAPKFLSLISYFNPKRVIGITLYPFIFVDDTSNVKLINHESIHLAQYKELFVIGFLLLYLYDWTIGLIKYKDFYKAYRQIRFEQEAYQHETNLNYLILRKKNSWKRYQV